MTSIVAKLQGSIETDYSGLKQLFKFYHYCRNFTKTTIYIDFYHLNWIDANLCSLFESIIYKLNNENGLVFSTDLVFLQEKFDILFRIGFIKTVEEIVDDRKSCVKARNFLWNQKREYNDYIKNELLGHRGMPKIDDELKEHIFDDLMEIFANAKHHSETELPFFVAGQYYPKSEKLKFTMVDLGKGFLPRIHLATKGEITTDLQAISWALQGNTSKLALERTSGGLGIKGMFDYCQKHQGELEIITGSGYWSSTFKGTAFQLGREISDNQYVGAIINLVFQK